MGVTIIGFNTEGMMTPSDELSATQSTESSRNSVVRFVEIAAAEGFDAIWGPIRNVSESVPDGAIEVMIDAGLLGVGLQEQRFIEASCVEDRVAAVEATAARYRAIAGARPFHVNVQVMPSRCLMGDSYAQSRCGTSGGRFFHCEDFTHGIEPSIDSHAIWASSPGDVGDLVELVAAMRR